MCVWVAVFYTEGTGVQIVELRYEGVPEMVEASVARFDNAIRARAQLLRHKLKDSPILSYRKVGTPLSIFWIRVVGTIEKVCQYRLWCRIAGCLVDDNGGMSIMVKHEISRNKMFFCVWIIYHVESSHR